MKCQTQFLLLLSLLAYIHSYNNYKEPTNSHTEFFARIRIFNSVMQRSCRFSCYLSLLSVPFTVSNQVKTTICPYSIIKLLYWSIFLLPQHKTCLVFLRFIPTKIVFISKILLCKTDVVGFVSIIIGIKLHHA